MKWGTYWPECLFIAAVLVLNNTRWFHTTDASTIPLTTSSTWTPEKKLAARERTRELWYHGYDNYMTYAFPMDELTPLSCSGQGPDWANIGNHAVNDVAGNFSLTLIDVLDTLVILDDRIGFEKAVKNVIEWVSFDVNTKPQVFETTIRVLGGLLSGHIFASKSGHPFHLPWYRGELLDLAHDLGERLLPAFSTPTGIPYARINLRKGIMKGETVETCTAGAGSLILEFATLSRLTGDDRFEKAAHKAFFGLWNRKSDIELVGNTINTWNGAWTHPETTGIGAGIDSFYEYALKWYIMSGDIEFLDVWDDAYAAIMRFSRAKDGYWYRTVNMHTGDVAYLTVDSLSAFWPGLQVLAGDVQNAIKSHMLYYNLWRQHSGLPEVFDTNYRKATSYQYPLRPATPEFIESTWYLYRATRDPFYLDVGERVLYDITTRAKVDCGLAGISDLRTNKLDDRMESFALSETLKYLYLLFDEENPLHSDDSNYVFTTEGHILTLDRDHMNPMSKSRKRTRNIESHECPAYTPITSGSHKSKPGLVQGVRSRSDMEYARHLVGTSPAFADESHWSPDGWCEKPRVDPYANGKGVPEDLSPSFLKLGTRPDGYIIHNVTGIRTQIVQRLDGQGYDIRKLGHYTVRPGQLVYINDPHIFPKEGNANLAQEEFFHREPEVTLRVFTPELDSMLDISTGLLGSKAIDVSVIGYTARFGADLSSHIAADAKGVTHKLRNPKGLSVRRNSANEYGCDPYEETYADSMLITKRGHCTFLEKLVNARAGSAAGIIVISDEEMGINPTANRDELVAAGNLDDVALVLLPKTAGEAFEELVNLTEKLHKPQVKIALQPRNMDLDEEQPGHPPVDTEEQPNPHRILYINGHPLINTRLLV
ncbi:hypothetical protein D9613_005188 [Agrocybe pediades]|uniref:alpha-1,2-Mannosidase n=1 Tax=Agrocybe pediades TaxID=84607 RepID=A0A8H4VS05_9AGAR|nr:hypothetical protein D9613_005188 [Agrocybe pediades]